MGFALLDRARCPTGGTAGACRNSVPRPQANGCVHRPQANGCVHRPRPMAAPGSGTGRKTVGSIAVVAGVVVVSVLHASIAAAQPYPSKAVRVITSNSPGGTSDTLPRALRHEPQRTWSPPVV